MTKKEELEQREALKEVLRRCQESPLFFIERAFNLIPQELNCQKGHDHNFKSCYSLFEKDKNITWQQAQVLQALADGKAGRSSRRISVASGNNIGKSTIAAWATLWFLLCHEQAQVSVTSPSQSQLYDVLWKECKLWLDKMPLGLRAFYDWQQTHIRMTPSPNTWFARAATARKETPEAFSGIHGENVLLVAEEASAIDDAIYITAEGTLASENSLVLLISNYTRAEGYFHDTFTKNRAYWKNFTFSSAESPLVPQSFLDIKAAEGLDSDAYRVFVLGLPPHAEGMDEQGFIPLIQQGDLRIVPDEGKMPENAKMGVDVGGEGKNETVWGIRDQFRARIIAREPFSTPKSVAEKTITLMSHYGIMDGKIYIDNFGVGANVAQELALSPKRLRVQAVNVGQEAMDKKSYINLRAEAYMRFRNWLRSGGELMRNEDWKQLLSIRYKVETSGKYRIMSKLEMAKRGIKSPDAGDALMLTFLDPEGSRRFGLPLSDAEKEDRIFKEHMRLKKLSTFNKPSFLRR